MCKRAILIGIVLAVCGAGDAKATIIEFHENAVIQEGDQYDRVSIFGDSIVVMTGGSVGQMVGYDSSTLIIIDGQVEWWFELGDSATAHLYGGTFDLLYAPAADAYFHIYGYDLTLEMPSSRYFLSGYWADGTPFELQLRRADTFGDQYVLHEIPEPTMLTFLVTGTFLLRRKTNGQNRTGKSDYV